MSKIQPHGVDLCHRHISTLQQGLRSNVVYIEHQETGLCPHLITVLCPDTSALDKPYGTVNSLLCCSFYGFEGVA